MKKIKKLLVANRGEIALRIMRTAKEMGILTVAVFSDADRCAPHTRYADEAYYLGPSPASKSYLNGEKIIEICKNHQIDAIHPGYGFLSENTEFARQVLNAGLIFIGPSPESIMIMGNKLEAKKAVSNYEIPLIPGTNKAIEDISLARETAIHIGYPILIKASSGGGGKGMRIVENEQNLESQMQRAISEAYSAFGDGAVFIEKLISSPRHIEIQILGDQYGNIVHLFERECSIQRRHQKVIEEAPSVVLTDKMRQDMGNAAIKVAKSCKYQGAGTVEFIVDEQMNFYFLEMNTRLQVEHPVTEMITGRDLVREQILIAEGHPLSFQQNEISINGHAIELRVYAEDPKNNFLPDIGTLSTYKRPQGPGIRVDDGFEEGMEIPIHYDPMVSKLVVHHENRELAMERLIRAIEEYQIVGVETTLSFGKWVMGQSAFRTGNFDTKFIEKYFKPEKSLEDRFSEDEKEIIASFAAYIYDSNRPIRQDTQPHINTKSNWRNR